MTYGIRKVPLLRPLGRVLAELRKMMVTKQTSARMTAIIDEGRAIGLEH
jgi:hypothetical protein